MSKGISARFTSVVFGTILLAFLAEAQVFKPLCTSPSFPSPPPATLPAIDSDCAVSGQPAEPGPETEQNTAKNNFCAAPASAITIAQLVDLQHTVQENPAINFGAASHPLSSERGPTTDRAPLGVLGEGQQRVLEGYVLIARQEGKEAVNCGTTPPNSAASHDIHISIVSSLSQVHGDECESVVAEMSPHHRPDSWTAANVQKVALAHRRVRVTGQLFFDSSHSPCVDGQGQSGDPRRSSLWELHPIYKFEVCPSGLCATKGWKPLDQWLKK